MNSFYESFSSKKKRSVNYSLRRSILHFLKEYRWDISSFRSEEDVIDSVYFYWFRRLAEQRYMWCEDLREEFFDECFVFEMKHRLRGTLRSVYAKRLRKSRSFCFAQ